MLSLIFATSLLYSATPASAFWRLLCDNTINVARMDPIVNPGGVSGHTHTIAGGSNFSFNSTYDDLRKSDCTSCRVTQDLSAYWTPLLYYQAQDGSFQDVQTSGGLVAYYLQRGDVPNYAFPKGFRMVAGNPFLRTNGSSLQQQAINFVCLDFDKGSSQSDALPNKNCPDGLRAQVAFPSCWDGVHLDSADHKSHMAYPSGVTTGSCPSGFPKRLVTLFYEVTYQVDAFNGIRWKDQPFVFAMGDPTGYGFHGDFLNGWDVDVLQKAVDTCTASSGLLEDCPVFNLTSNQQCHQSPQVNEVVTGKMKALPGCNPVQVGPKTATPQTCPGMTTPAMISNFTAYKGNVVPPGYFTLPGTPRVVESYSSWQSLGCMSDTGSRPLPQGMSVSNMTVEKCLDACQKGGYKYGGVEYADECYCSNTFNATSISFERCDMACEGNSTELCGGSNAIQVYNNTAVTAPSIPLYAVNSQFIGCYVDSSSRAMSFGVNNNNNTVEGCIASCNAGSHKYAGVEYGGQCWCSDSVPTSQKAAQTDCNMKCNGNPNQLCGGSLRLQVYAPRVASSSTTSSSKSTSTSSTRTTSATSFKTTTTQTSATSVSMRTTNNQAVSTSSSSIPKTVGAYKYAGCYSDSGTRSLRNKVDFDGTVSGCISACSAKSYTLVGLEYGQECYCDTVLNPSSTLLADSACNMQCTKSSDLCGGSSALQLYNSKSTITRPAIPTIANWNYTGCYVDSNHIWKGFSTSSDTVQACTDTCSAKGYTFAGIEYGGECYCSNTAPTTSLAPNGNSECNMICKGDDSKLCGAGSRLQVYKLLKKSTRRRLRRWEKV